MAIGGIGYTPNQQDFPCLKIYLSTLQDTVQNISILMPDLTLRL